MSIVVSKAFVHAKTLHLNKSENMKIYLFIITMSLVFSVFAQNKEIAATQTEACLTVNVINPKNKPQAGEAVSFVDKKTKKTFSGITKADGKFKILIPKNASYIIKYKTFSNDVDYSEVTIPLAKDTLLNFNINIQFELPKTYTLDNVFFDTGKATLRPESYRELNELAEFMILKKNIEIEIAGHTDNVGAKESNQKLSQERANAVKIYLTKKGLTSERVVANGYGDAQPVASNESKAGRQKNRRTEVRITKE